MTSEREIALRAAEPSEIDDQIVDARKVNGKEFRQMVSLRMEPNLIVALRELADTRNESLSEVIRAAAESYVRSNQPQRFRLQTTSVWEAPFVATNVLITTLESLPTPSAASVGGSGAPSAAW